MTEYTQINELIEDCKRLIPSAQVALVRRFGPILMTVSKRFVYDKMSAEDILQDAFVLIFQNLRTLKTSDYLLPWMKRIVINTALKELKKKHRMFVDIDDHSHTQFAEPEINYKLNVDEIMKLIAELPAGYREVFCFSVIDGYSHDEIGELLGINASTSRSQLTRARKLLQFKLSHMGYEMERVGR